MKLLFLKVAVLETTITEKKRQIDKLVADIKEANLQSLAISPPDELKFILEGKYFLLLISILFTKLT